MPSRKAASAAPLYSGDDRSLSVPAITLMFGVAARSAVQ
jgi:hypothetical protein